MAKKATKQTAPAPVVIDVPAVVVSTNDRLAQKDDWQFPIVTSPLVGENGVRTGLVGVFRADDKPAYFGQYTHDKKLLTHTAVVETVRAALEKQGAKWSENIQTTFGGARMYARFNIERIKGPGGEEYSSILEAQNALDNSFAFQMGMWAERLACLNGVQLREMLEAQRQRHSFRLDVQSVADRIPGLLAHARKEVADLATLASIPVTIEQGATVLDNLARLKKNPLSERMAGRIKTAWFVPSADEKPLGDNLYRLLNAGTRTLRDIQGMESFELARRTMPIFTQALDLAARNKGALEALTTAGSTAYYFN